MLTPDEVEAMRRDAVESKCCDVRVWSVLQFQEGCSTFADSCPSERGRLVLNGAIYPHSSNQMTLAVALNSFKNQYGDFRDARLLMAASIVTMLRCIVLFFAAQRQLVGGLTLGAVKG